MNFACGSVATIPDWVLGSALTKHNQFRRGSTGSMVYRVGTDVSIPPGNGLRVCVCVCIYLYLFLDPLTSSKSN